MLIWQPLYQRRMKYRMSTTAQKAQFFTEIREQACWRLLAGDKAALTIALLQKALLTEDRKLYSSLFHERIKRELEQLRAHGWVLPQTAQMYISQWLSDGYLERTYPQNAPEEIYELSSAAIQAIRFAEGLDRPHQVATESRLSLVIQQLSQLAEQTDRDKRARIKRLQLEREKIEMEIKAIESGRITVLPKERALERAREIVALAEALTNDFRKVRDNFQDLNRRLREQIVENDGSRGEVLEKLFSGVDVIAESDAGRTFTAFWRLLIDPEQSLELKEATEKVLSRNFVGDLTPSERRFLSKFTRILLEEAGTVHEVLHYFAGSLKRFVQSRAYQEQRRLLSLLRGAQRLSLEVKEKINPTEVIFPKFYLCSSKIRSVSQLFLYDPSLNVSALPMQEGEASEISLDMINAWVAASEINFRLLKEHIAELLQSHAQISIQEILKVFPAEQGLGTVVGYVSLGFRYGMASSATQSVSWKGSDGIGRSAKIPCIYFLEEQANEFRSG